VLAEKHAQAGERLSIPKSQAIVAAKKVAASIGLKSQDLLLLDTFGAVTQTQDWEQGRRPIVWPSNIFLMDQTGFSLATLRRHIRRLCEAGVIWMKDSPNGKRWGKRDDDGVIVEAYGFDLSPLSARTVEFEHLHAQIQEERRFCASTRNSITITRRVIRAKIEKALDSGLRGPWRDLRDEFDVLLEALPKRSTAPNKLLDILDWFKAFKDRVEQAFEDAFDWPEESDEQDLTHEPSDGSNVVLFDKNMRPTSLTNETHILTTKQPNPVTSNRFEKKHAAKTVPETPPLVEDERSEEVDLDINWSSHGRKRGSEVDIRMLMIACPHFAEMARNLENGYIRSWNDLHRAAAKVRGMAGISEDAWNAANQVMGPAIAAATIALIFDKQSTGEVNSAGGYLRAMVQRAQNGELHLDRSFYGRLSEVRTN
jgi:replication initiation protein RepC